MKKITSLFYENTNGKKPVRETKKTPKNEIELAEKRKKEIK